jgi:hypothetical protein
LVQFSVHIIGALSLMLAVSLGLVAWQCTSPTGWCVGWASHRGEADAVVGDGKLILVWGPPVTDFLPLPQTPGLKHNVGAWDILAFFRAGAISGPGSRLYRSPQKLTIVAQHRPHYDESHWRCPAAIEEFRWHGFSFTLDLIAYPENSTAVIYARELQMPTLALLVVGALFALLPLAMVVRRATAFRRLPGHCPCCQYSLTGNTSGICPECGTPVSTELHAASAGQRFTFDSQK